MRLLVLNVDRDNDLGRKTGIPGPVIGRDKVLEAATALAVADPEEADANGMFAAVKEYDEIARDLPSYGADALFVAAVTGHIREGTHADTVIAHQIDQIMAATGADHVIIVSDGGEDEHVMPIIQTRLKVDGIRRVIIKQAKNLEGALYLFNRLMNDEKLQRRFFLPLALLLVAAAFAFLFNKPEIFVAALLFIGAFYVFVQVFKGKEPVQHFVARIGSELRAGKLSFGASLLALVIIVFSGFWTLREISERTTHSPIRDTIDYTLTFSDLMLWWLVLAVVTVIVGRALDEVVREHRMRPRYWQAFFFTLGIAVVLETVLEAAIDFRVQARPLLDVPTAKLMTGLFFGGFLVFLGLIARRYYAQSSERIAEPAPLPPT